MSSGTIRDPLADHLITPQNAALILIDYQPSQFATVRSMDPELLLKNIVTTVKTAKTFRLPIVHSTVNVASGQGKPTVSELAELRGRADESVHHPAVLAVADTTVLREPRVERELLDRAVRESPDTTVEVDQFVFGLVLPCIPVCLGVLVVRLQRDQLLRRRELAPEGGPEVARFDIEAVLDDP